MLVSCPFTGTKYTNKQLCAANSTQPHPVFALKPLELARACSNYQHRGQTDQYLLFMACAVGSGLFRFSAPLPASSLSAEFITANLPSMLAIYRWLYERPSLSSHLPQFVVDGTTNQQQIHEYLKIVSNARAEGVKLRSIGDGIDVLALDIDERRTFRRAVASTLATKKERFTVTVNWAVNMLTLSDGVDHGYSLMLNNVLSGIANKQGVKYAKAYPISSIKTLKGICLDNLPEENHDQALRKSEIIQGLDNILLERYEVMAVLGDDSDRTTIAKEVGFIADTYTIERNGQRHQNDAAPQWKQINSIREIGASNDSSEQKWRGQPEPKLADFKNRLAYMAAHNQWKLENR